MDDLLAEFVAETREMLEAIGSELVAWEADPADRARLDAIFRFVHTVKGNCGFFDFPRLEKLSHAAESALAEVRAGRRQADSQFVSAVLAVIDRIDYMTGAIEAGEPMPKQGDGYLIAALGSDAEEIGAGFAEKIGAVGENPSTNAGTALRSIRLPVGLLDRVMSGVSDMVLARNDLARRLRDAGNEPTLDGPFERLSGILTDVRDAITRMRMQRIEHLYNALPRLVRDLSAELGKQVMVDFDGGNVELDREMIEMIRDPVTHLIRNALDHGIETPTERRAAGKREIGMLSIATRQSGNKITIMISDDGAGLNSAKIAEKAIAAGLLTQTDADTMPSEAIDNLIFEAGLSTADHVSSVSGRGVGMDIVRANVEKIGGSISVKSTEGEGTIFYLQIPLTLSIISALTVSVGGQRFAIPQSYVEEIAHGKSAAVAFSRVGDTDLVTFRERRIPCLTLNNILDVNPRAAGDDQRLVLLRLGNDELFALAVDKIHDQEDLVIKPLSPAVMQCGTYAGTTLLDDGSPVLMLDIPTIASKHGLAGTARLRPAHAQTEAPPEKRADIRRLMSFTGFDGRIRAISLDLVSRIDQVPSTAFDFDGQRAHVVIDSKLFALAGASPDDILQEQVKVLRLSDSESDLAFAVAELGESIEFSGDLTRCEDDPMIEGIALINELPVPILDGFQLFARYGTHAAPLSELVCRLPEADEWIDRMVAPLVRAAGYRIADADEENPDITITIANSEAPDGSAASDAADNVIVLHSDINAIGAGPGHIYRYDRSALSAALSHVRSATKEKRA